jgi:Low molecular weight phosphotyrosine protein phosphatase
MKFSFGNKSKINTKKTILFVCVENAGRSQMAEGFFRKYASDGYKPISAGTKPTSKINPLAIQVMNELGIDIRKPFHTHHTHSSAAPTILYSIITEVCIISFQPTIVLQSRCVSLRQAAYNLKIVVNSSLELYLIGKLENESNER